MKREEIEARVFMTYFNDNDELVALYRQWEARKRFTRLPAFEDELMDAFWEVHDKTKSKAAAARSVKMPDTTFKNRLEEIGADVFRKQTTFERVRDKIEQAVLEASFSLFQEIPIPPSLIEEKDEELYKRNIAALERMKGQLAEAVFSDELRKELEQIFLTKLAGEQARIARPIGEIVNKQLNFRQFWLSVREHDCVCVVGSGLVSGRVVNHINAVLTTGYNVGADEALVAIRGGKMYVLGVGSNFTV